MCVCVCVGVCVCANMLRHRLHDLALLRNSSEPGATCVGFSVCSCSSDFGKHQLGTLVLVSSSAKLGIIP